MTALNKNNSAVKRIMQEAKELANDPSTDYSAAPLEDDIFEWHCTLRGPPGTEFEGGLYHFRILLPAEYPFRPPAVMMLTPNGRFELNTKICISFTNYHEELWQPAWGVRTAIIGLQGFFPLKGQAAVGVGSIEYPPIERRRLANLSREWTCPHCQQTNLSLLPDPPTTGQGEAPVPEPDLISTTTILVSTDAPTDSDSTTTKRFAETIDPKASITTVQSESPSQSNSPDQSPLPSGDHINRAEPKSGPGPERNETPSVPQASRRSSESRSSNSNRRSQKPPVLLDTTICILLVLLFAIICRRMV